MYGLSMTRWCGCSFGSRHSVSAHPQPAAERQSGRTASAHRCVHQSVLEDYRTSSARAHSQAFLMVLASYSPSDGKSAPMRARSFHSQHENNARERCSQKERDDVEGWGYGLPCAGSKEVLRGCCALRCVLTTPTSVVTCDKEASQEREGQRRQRTSRVDFGLGTWHW